MASRVAREIVTCAACHGLLPGSCGFVGFAPRTRRELLGGKPPEFGGVPLSATHAFRHQPFVGRASTQHLVSVDGPGEDAPSKSASLRHFDQLVLGNTARKAHVMTAMHEVGAGPLRNPPKAKRAHSPHHEPGRIRGSQERAHVCGVGILHLTTCEWKQVLPPLLWLSEVVPSSVPILLDLSHPSTRKMLELVREIKPAVNLGVARVEVWTPELYSARELYFYGEWPYLTGEDERVMPVWKGTYFSRPLMSGLQGCLEKLHSAHKGGDPSVLVILSGSDESSIGNPGPLAATLLTLIYPEPRIESHHMEDDNLHAAAAGYAGAGLVILLEGPGLAPLVFCRPGTSVVEVGGAGVSSGRGAGHAWGKLGALLSASLGLTHFASPAAWDYQGACRCQHAGMCPL